MLKLIVLHVIRFLDFFRGPENAPRFARCHFRAPKSLDFQGPPIPMALVMDLPVSKQYVPRHINILNNP